MKWSKAVCDKLDEKGCQVFQDIEKKVLEQGNILKSEDFNYAYRKDGSKIKLGRLLRNIDEQLALDYARYKQKLKYRRGEGTLFISQLPEDVLAKSTGQNWSSCGSVGGMDFPGIFTDISANNAIAYLKLKDKPNWVGRRMLRWCVRKDDGKPDVFIERYYGNPNYADLTKNKLIEILREHGFSGVPGNTVCLTPYEFKGYADSGQKTRIESSDFVINEGYDPPSVYEPPKQIEHFTGIRYNVGDRGGKNE
jgi:hypothetical protein